MKKKVSILLSLFLVVGLFTGCETNEQARNVQDIAESSDVAVDQLISTPTDVANLIKPYAEKAGVKNIQLIESVNPNMVLVRTRENKEYKVTVYGDYPNLKLDEVIEMPSGEWVSEEKFGDSVMKDTKKYILQGFDNLDGYVKIDGKTLNKKDLDELNPFYFVVKSTYTDGSVYKFKFSSNVKEVKPIGQGVKQ